MVNLEKEWKDMSAEEQKNLIKEATDLRKKINEDFYSKGGLDEQIVNYINEHDKLDDEELSRKLEEHFREYGALDSLIQNANLKFLGNTMPNEETNRIVNEAMEVLMKYHSASMMTIEL